MTGLIHSNFKILTKETPTCHPPLVCGNPQCFCHCMLILQLTVIIKVLQFHITLQLYYKITTIM